MSEQCDATTESDEFAPVLFYCQRDKGHNGDHEFITDTDFAVLTMVHSDAPIVTEAEP